MKRNRFKKLIISGILALLLSMNLSAQKGKLPMADGPFKATDESLLQYKYPDWFRDAKFGIWSHWGPQAVPRQGDWYAKRMYQEKNPAYKYHVEHFGHPSVFGYKDIIPLWKAETMGSGETDAVIQKGRCKIFRQYGNTPRQFLPLGFKNPSTGIQ
ncbi:MAG: alpha-L-fucosidase [Ignavibacteriales bacterium]|nr:alpha-L-fucosidase [Ignavibacteriales bacterium]